MTRNNEKNLWMKRNVIRMSIVTRTTLTSASIATEEGGTRWRGANRDATAAATGATPLEHACARHFNSNVERCKILIQREATSWGVRVQANIHSYLSIRCGSSDITRGFHESLKNLLFCFELQLQTISTLNLASITRGRCKAPICHNWIEKTD